MATFTITTGSEGSPIRIDTLTGKAGGDLYNVNAGYLTIDQDTRYGLEQTTSTTLGNITLSATLGGTLDIDARYVRIIPYDGGTGNVPTLGTTIAGASGSGKLIGVWSALNSAPTASGAAMPVSGYIKIKQWNGSAYADNETLTGIGATVNGTDRTGWIEVVGDEASGITGSRLNTIKFRGGYFYLGTTTGSNTDTFQIPTSGSNFYGSGVWLDKTASVNISSASWASSVVTFNTSSAHNLTTGDQVLVEGATPSAYNGDYVVTVVDSDTFTATLSSDPGTYTSGGTAVAIEFYPNAKGITATSSAMATDAVRGKVCWIDTSGVVRFQNDGSSSTGGYLPPSGRAVRIPNIITQTCTTAARTANAAPNATITTRYDLTTTGAPSVDIRNTYGTWYFSLTASYAVTIKHSILSTRIVLGNVASPPDMVNAHVASWDTSDVPSTGVISLTNAQQGGSYVNCNFYRSSHTSNSYCLNSSDSINHIFDRCGFICLVTRTGTTSGTIQMQRCDGFEFVEPRIGVAGASLLTVSNTTFTDTTFWSEPAGATSSSNAYFLWTLTSSSNDNTFDGLTFGGLTKAAPYSGLLSIGSGSSGNDLRNIGTYASPLDCGAAQVDGVSWSRSGTTVTVTSTAHGLSTNDVIYPVITSNAATITQANKTITVVDANTFTFTGLNAGDSSGTMSYYLVISAYVYQISNSSAANGLSVSRVYVNHLRTGMYTVDNTSKGVSLKDVFGDYSATPSFNANNMTVLGAGMSSAAAAQNAVYGTHWWVQHIAKLQGTTSATWTRSSTTVTATLTGHNQRMGLNSAYVTASSDESALPLGTRSIVSNTGVPTLDTMNITGVAAGGTSGTATIKLANARIGLAMNEETTDTADTYDVVSGNPQFTSTGSLSMPTVGDEIVFYSPEIKGVSEVMPLEAIMGTATLSNYDIKYAIDPLDGSGYGTEKPLSVVRLNSTTTSGSASVTVSSTTGLAVGNYVYGTGMPGDVKIQSIDSGTTLTLDKNANTTSAVATLRFNNLPNETLDPTGFKFKWRFTTNTANSNGIVSLYVACRSTDADRANQYSQTVDTVSFTISGLPSGTTAALYDNTDTELQRNDNITSGEFVYSYIHSGVDFTDNYYVIWHEDYVPYKSDLFDLTATDLGLSYTPVSDTVYDAAYDDRYTIDYANKRIIMGTGENTYDVRGAYSKWKADIYNSNNFTYDFAFSTIGNVTYNSPKRIPAFTELTNSWKIRPREASHTLTVENGILYATSGADPFVDTTGSYVVRIMYSQPVEVLTVSTGSGVTPGDITDIADAVWDEALSGHTTSGTAGKTLQDAADDAELAAIK